MYIFGSCRLLDLLICLYLNVNLLVFQVGIGSSMQLYDLKTNDLLQSTEALPCRTIHGIKGSKSCAQENDLFCCFGEKNIRIWHLQHQNKCLNIEFVCDPWDCEDWIWDVQWMRNEDKRCLALALGHNTVLLWRWEDSAVLQRVTCEETCIIYCAHFIGENWKDLILASGTVFNQVVLWSVQGEITDTGQQKALHRLTGHKGVIFGIDYHPGLGRLCSVSDDRSIRVWQLSPLDQLSHLGQLPPLDQVYDLRLGTFTSMCVLFGHSARVWSVRLLTDKFVSVGEDSSCCVWDYNGGILQKFKGHKGKSIWSLAVNQTEDIVATGGGDHSVRLWKLNTGDRKQKDSSTRVISPAGLQTVDFPRTVTLIDFNTALVMTNDGYLFEGKLDENKWVTVLEDSEFKSYTVLSVSPNHRVIALGNILGTLQLITTTDRWDEKRQTVKIKSFDGRIFSIVWLNDVTMLTTGPEGHIKIWNVVESIGRVYGLDQIYNDVYLPDCKQRWVTTACLIPNSQLLICGDKMGNILVYTLEDQQQGEGKTIPLQILPRIHGKAGTTFIGFHDNHVYSCGRDGLYRDFTVEDQKLVCHHEHRAFKGFDWLDHLLFTEDDLLIVGFHSSNFIIWSCNSNQKLVEIECGGGHRTWQCQRSINGPIRFIYLKANKVMLSQAHILSDQIILKGSLHGRELCNTKHMTSFTINGQTVDILLTCSEDTNITLTAICSSTNHPPTLSVLQELKGHISSVRAISLVETGDQSDKEFVMFSAGGRAQMKAWRINIGTKIKNDDEMSYKTGMKSSKCVKTERETGIEVTQSINCDGKHIFTKDGYKNKLSVNDLVCSRYELLSSHMLFDPRKRRSKPWKQKLTSADPETRYMDLTSFSCSLIDPSMSVICVIAACSDAIIRVFLYNCELKQFTCVLQSSFHDHCVLKVSHFLHVDEVSGKQHVFLYSGATDGRVAFWNITEALKSFVNISWPVQDTSGTFNSDTCMTSDLGPPLLVLNNHQSGINSICIHRQLDGDYLLLTGGDDNSICVRTLTVDVRSDGDILISDRLRCDVTSAHSAQVTGAHILSDELLVTSSIDQRVCLWKIQREKTNLKVTQAGCKFVNVSDVSNMDVWKLSDGCGYGVAVAGEGLQILHISTSSR